MKPVLLALFILAACRRETPVEDESTSLIAEAPQSPPIATSGARAVAPDAAPSARPLALFTSPSAVVAPASAPSRAVRSSPHVMAMSAPVTLAPASDVQVHGTEIIIPCDFHHGRQRMNVRLHTEEYRPELWSDAAFRTGAIGAGPDGRFAVQLIRRREGVDTAIRTERMEADFPRDLAFSVSEEWQYGDLLVIPWSPGLMARRMPDGSIAGVTVSIVDNQSNDPVTRPAYAAEPK